MACENLFLFTKLLNIYGRTQFVHQLRIQNLLCMNSLEVIFKQNLRACLVNYNFYQSHFCLALKEQIISTLQKGASYYHAATISCRVFAWLFCHSVVLAKINLVWWHTKDKAFCLLPSLGLYKWIYRWESAIIWLWFWFLESLLKSYADL